LLPSSATTPNKNNQGETTIAIPRSNQPMQEDNTQEHKHWILINGANWNHKIKNYCYGISNWY
jgi:hypothetical protein